MRDSGICALACAVLALVGGVVGVRVSPNAERWDVTKPEGCSSWIVAEGGLIRDNPVHVENHRLVFDNGLGPFAGHGMLWVNWNRDVWPRTRIDGESARRRRLLFSVNRLEVLARGLYVVTSKHFNFQCWSIAGILQYDTRHILGVQAYAGSRHGQWPYPGPLNFSRQLSRFAKRQPLEYQHNGGKAGRDSRNIFVQVTSSLARGWLGKIAFLVGWCLAAIAGLAIEDGCWLLYSGYLVPWGLRRFLFGFPLFAAGVWLVYHSAPALFG